MYTVDNTIRLQKKGLLSFSAEWMKLEVIRLSKVSQGQVDRCHFTLSVESKNIDFRVTQRKWQIPEAEKSKEEARRRKSGLRSPRGAIVR
jgi:hypothetical protein